MSLFRRLDPVDRQLRDMERQGSVLASVAHVCSFILLILFSLASLLALGYDSFAQVAAQWQASHSVSPPAAISLAVSTLFVLCMDVANLWAAQMLRALALRRAPWRERWLHVAVMIVVSLIEAGTYVYMAVLYEHPAGVVPWLLIGARALVAPGLSAYLSLAKPAPVTARDIMALAEMGAARGYLHDVHAVASDDSAPLEVKAAVYGAVARMAADDRARLDDMTGVVQSYLAPPATEMPGPTWRPYVAAGLAVDGTLGGSTPAMEGASDSNPRLATPGLAALPSALPEKVTPAFVQRLAAFAMLDTFYASGGVPMAANKLAGMLNCGWAKANKLVLDWQAERGLAGGTLAPGPDSLPDEASDSGPLAAEGSAS